jgi:hypothetical protein
VAPLPPLPPLPPNNPPLPPLPPSKEASVEFQPLPPLPNKNPPFCPFALAADVPSAPLQISPQDAATADAVRRAFGAGTAEAAAGAAAFGPKISSHHALPLDGASGIGVSNDAS